MAKRRPWVGSLKGGGSFYHPSAIPSHNSVAVVAMQGGVLLQLSSMLAAYQARNVTTVFNNQYPVWQVGQESQAVGPAMGQRTGDGTIVHLARLRGCWIELLVPAAQHCPALQFATNDAVLDAACCAEVVAYL